MTSFIILDSANYRRTVRPLEMLRVSKIPVYVSETSKLCDGDVVYFVTGANKNMVVG